MSEQPEDKTYTVSAAALDQIHGRIMAAEIIAVRLWGFLSMTQPNPKVYLEGQITQCLQSVDIRQIEGGNAVQIKRFARNAITDLFRGLVGRPTGSRLQ
jgi:hypothetical protein